MRVFLTGGTGFIGSHLVRELITKGHDPVVLSRHHSHGVIGAQVMVGDLKDPSTYERSLSSCEAIIHNALIWGNESEEAAFVDCQATHSLLKLAERATVNRVIYMSSAAVHRPFAVTMSENSIGAPNDLYAQTKIKNEAQIREFGKEHSRSFLILRPGPVVGSPAYEGAPHRSDRRIESWVHSALQNVEIQLPSEFGRQFTSVVSLGAYCAESLTSSVDCDTVLAMSSEVTPWRRVAERIIELTGSRSKVVEPASFDVPFRFSTEELARSTKIDFDSASALDQHISALIQRS